MGASARNLNAAKAAEQRGVSARALRLHEERGLLAPARTAAGWRAYGPDQSAHAAEIVRSRAVATCLAPPDARARTEGEIARRASVA